MNKFQFGTGAITPQQQPVQFEYKPLGIEAFAQPLAQKQQQYDSVTNAVEQADFGISGLDADDERSVAISQEITGRKDEILDNLNKTKNFKEAAKKLQELNKIYNKDDEVVAIQTQRAAFLEADAEAKERVGKKGYTQKDYEEWYFKTLNEYGEKGGLGFNRETGRHNSVNTNLRGKNLEKEIMDIARATANMEPTQRENYIRNSAEFSDMDTDALLKTLVETRKYGDVERSVTNFLKSSERYSSWVSEDADYEYYSRSRQEKDFDKNIIKGKYEYFDNVRTSLTEASNDMKITKDDRANAKELLAELNKNEEEYSTLHREALDQDNEAAFGEATFKEDKQSNRLSRIGSAAADLVDMRSITNTLTQRDDASGKAAKEKLDKITDYQVNAQQPQFKTSTSPYTQGGGSGATAVTRGKAFQKNQQELYKDVSVPDQSSEQMITKKAIEETDQYANMTTANQQSFEKAFQDTDYSYSMMKRIGKWDTEIDKISTDIIDLQAKLPTLNGNEKKEAYTQLNELQGNIREANISMEGEFHYLDNLFAEEAAKKGGEWITEAYKQGGRKQVFETIYDHNNAIIQDLNGQFIMENIPEVDEHGDIIHQWKLGDTELRSTLLNAKLKDTLGSNVFNQYRKAMAAQDTANPTEIIINDESNLYTGNGLKKLSDQVANNEAKSPSAAVPVTFDPGTGVATYKPNAQTLDYDIEAFYNEQPAYVGASTIGGIPLQILRYNRPDLKPAEVRAILATEIHGSNTERNRDAITAAELATFELNNPEELFLSVEGTSLDIEANAEKTYTELGDAAMTGKDPYAFEIALGSFAAINITTDNTRRTDYGEMATTLLNSMNNEIEDIEVTQPPSYWHDNGDDTYSGHRISYHYDKDSKGIVADITLLTYGKGIDGTTESPLTTKNINALNSTSLYSLDLIYGAGNETDMAINPRTGQPFVPAFNNQAFTKSYNTH